MQYFELMIEKPFMTVSEFKGDLQKGTLIGFTENNKLINCYPVWKVEKKIIYFILGKRKDGSFLIDNVSSLIPTLCVNIDPIIVDINANVIKKEQYIEYPTVNSAFVSFDIAYFLKKRNFREPTMAAYYINDGVPVLRPNLIHCMPENVNLSWVEYFHRNEFHSNTRQIIPIDYNIPDAEIENWLDTTFKNTGINLSSYSEKDWDKINKNEIKNDNFYTFNECYSAPTYEQVRLYFLNTHNISIDIAYRRVKVKGNIFKTVYRSFYINVITHRRLRINLRSKCDTYELAREHAIIDLLKKNYLFAK